MLRACIFSHLVPPSLRPGIVSMVASQREPVRHRLYYVWITQMEYGTVIDILVVTQLHVLRTGLEIVEKYCVFPVV